MGKTKPIRKLSDVKKLENYFKGKGEWRNYALVVMGLNTALRISDILWLKWKDVYNFENMRYKEYLILNEKKTGKETQIKLNDNCIEALRLLSKTIGKCQPQRYIFKSRTGENRPINRYQAWRQGIPSALLMDIYNHSSMEITKRYLSIDQDDKDSVFTKILL